MVQTESIRFETQNAYRYIKDIEHGKGRYRQSRIVADIEAFFQSVTPAELQGELIFYKSPPNSYDELLGKLKYRGRTLYVVCAGTQSFCMNSGAFHGLERDSLVFC